LLLLLLIALATLAASAGSVLVLVRNVVPRIRRYSRFAEGVRSSASTEKLHPRGRDELANLGRALDEMVVAQRTDREQEAMQAEFSQMMQVAATEDEAYDLLSRQLDRAVGGGRTVVLNRNNSADRLEPASTLPPDSHLEERLIAAEPRSCLAVRFGRMHREGPGNDPLMSCEVCGKTGSYSVCEPLLVSGEVIGAALVLHPEPLTARELGALTSSVGQAAPVLANLRNLALAEFRAATDALTGLPNSRAARDTLKRMVAQAARMVSPLSALLLDLDHFKQINDSFGHGRGDDVLAAVGSVLPSVLREADFAARYGGEEFLILLPATGHDEAALVAEKVRATIETIRVAGVNREITASIGIAAVPEDAGDADTLVRHADRALYTAKANGRNQVKVAEPAPTVAAIS
jgi:diguanylate cyclase (GGDEF)-like protein